MRMCVAILLAASACRFGFTEVNPPVDADLPADAAPPIPGVARVTVVGEEGEALAGQPIANAYVVEIEATGMTTTVRTAANGTASVPIAGLSSIHIARPAPDLGATRWLVYSFTGLNGDVDILAGGRAVPAVGAMTMTAVLPAFLDVAITESRVRGPSRCVTPDQAVSTGTTAVFTFASACNGESVPLYAQALGSGAPWNWLALGTIMLAPGATQTATSTWQDNNKYHVGYAGLPASIHTVWGVIALPGASSGDAIVLDETSSSNDAGDAAVTIDAPPLIAGSMIGSVFDDSSGAIERITIEHVDASFGNRMFDLANLGPDVTVPIADAGAQQIRWASSGLAGADFVAVQADIAMTTTAVTWNAYGPASTTQLTYPTLPAALAMIMPGAGATWAPPALQIVTLSELTYASALPILDRDLVWWRDVGAYLPAGTIEMSTAHEPTTARTAPHTHWNGALRDRPRALR